MAGWRERLRALRYRLLGGGVAIPDAPASGSEHHSPQTPSDPHIARTGSPQRTVAINLGIDFGTSFTKVCFRDVGTEESGVVTVGEGFQQAIIPSVVAIASTGRLYLGDDAGRGKSPVSIAYLKMRLAGAPIGDALPAFDGLDLNRPDCVRALAAWFLASVIVRSQEWMDLHQSDRLKNRLPVWSANVGVPVEHFDSDLLKTFEEVLGVAWLWVKHGRIPSTIQDAISRYNQTVLQLNDEVTDFHAVPEIAAAVQSFVMSRQAVPGIYVYFDVGGGTIDGVAFDYINWSGERRINFYSGKVEPLGISAIGVSLGENAPEEIDALKLEALLNKCPAPIHDDFVQRVRQLVGGVIMMAKKKDGRNWQQDAIQNRDYERRFVGRLPPSRMRPLVLFIGGGGSKSNWYKSTIASTYSAFQHGNAGIPPYNLQEVPKPSDFAMEGIGDDEFIRFAISYGLSIPFGEGPDVGLPRQFADAEKPRQWQPPGGVNYADSKDLC